jgi:hypothetical protein
VRTDEICEDPYRVFRGGMHEHEDRSPRGPFLQL